MTNRADIFKECGVYDPDISNHLMVYGILTERMKYHQSKVITFRGFKNLDIGKLKETLSIAPWHVGEMFDCVEDCYDYWIKLLRTILQEYLPVKKMKVRAKEVPYMTTTWKSAIRSKRKFVKRYSQNKTLENLEVKRKWRNEATRQRRIAIKQHWKEVVIQRIFFKLSNHFWTERTRRTTGREKYIYPLMAEWKKIG